MNHARTSRLRTSCSRLTIVTLLTVGLAGCSALGGDDTTVAATTTAAAPSAVPASPDPSASAAVQPVGAIKSVQVTKDGSQIRFDIVSLKVTGQLLRLDMRISNLDPAATASSVLLTDLLGTYGSFSQIFLEDSQNLQRYPTATTPDGCACTVDENRTFVDAGESADAFALFKIPPAGVSSIDIVLPNGLPRIDAAPITR